MFPKREGVGKSQKAPGKRLTMNEIIYTSSEAVVYGIP